jgi:SMODS-associated and fused to various effectors sensor domain
MPKNVTRYIDEKTEREIWGRAAGRCQFADCNRLLYKSPVTQERVNISQRAHIYSFAKDGPRGRGPFAAAPAGLNKVGNLMLVCYDCHKKIDGDKKGVRYSAELLKTWKQAHEARIRIVTGISPNKKSHVVLFGAKVGDDRSPIQYDDAVGAMFPLWYPADERPVGLSMLSSDDDSMPEYWATEARNLDKEFDRQIRGRLDEPGSLHFSVFALAPQPLLIRLGSLLTDKINVAVYQLHRTPKTWQWQPHPDGFSFQVIEPKDKTGTPVLVFSLSAKIAPERIAAVVPGKLSIWEVTIDQPHNDFLRSEAQLSMFRGLAPKLMAKIAAAHPGLSELKIFPAMPVSCAVELGRIRMPKADTAWAIFDQNNKHQRFIPALTIGNTK